MDRGNQWTAGRSVARAHFPEGKEEGKRPTTAVPNLLLVQLDEDDAGKARGVKAFLFTEQVVILLITPRCNKCFFFFTMNLVSKPEVCGTLMISAQDLFILQQQTSIFLQLATLYISNLGMLGRTGRGHTSGGGWVSGAQSRTGCQTADARSRSPSIGHRCRCRRRLLQGNRGRHTTQLADQTSVRDSAAMLKLIQRI